MKFCQHTSLENKQQQQQQQVGKDKMFPLIKYDMSLGEGLKF